MVTRTRLTTQAHKQCKEIIVRQTPIYGRHRSTFTLLLNRMLSDCYEDYNTLTDSGKHSTLLRIHYLSRQIESNRPFLDFASLNIPFKDFPNRIITSVINFNNKNSLFLKKEFIPCVIVLDYINSIESSGLDFLDFYLTKHKPQ